MKILILCGLNLNLLGRRELQIFGSPILTRVTERLAELASSLRV
jgi:3-dehydroquinate dehydratase